MTNNQERIRQEQGTTIGQERDRTKTRHDKNTTGQESIEQNRNIDNDSYYQYKARQLL